MYEIKSDKNRVLEKYYPNIKKKPFKVTYNPPMYPRNAEFPCTFL